LRAYVPAVFEYHPDRYSPDRVVWLPSFPAQQIMRASSYKWVKGEIEMIGRELSSFKKLVDKKGGNMRNVLEKHGWGKRKDHYVTGCPDDKRIAWRYDGIKNRTWVWVWRAR